MDNIQLRKFCFALLFLVLSLGIVQANILDSALIEGYHEPLYTQNISMLTTDVPHYIFIPNNLDVEDFIFSDNLIVEDSVAVGINEPLSSLHVRLSESDDSARFSIQLGWSNAPLLTMKGGSTHDLSVSRRGWYMTFEASGENKHIKINPAGNVGINIGNNNPQETLEVDGNAVFMDGRLSLASMSYNKIINLANPINDGDAVNKRYLTDQIVEASSKWKTGARGDIYYDEGNVLVRGKLGVGTIPTEAVTVDGSVRVDEGAYFVGNNEGMTTSFYLFEHNDLDGCEVVVEGGIITGFNCFEPCQPITDCNDISMGEGITCGRFFAGCGEYIICGSCQEDYVCGLEEDWSHPGSPSGIQRGSCVPDTGCNPVVDVPQLEESEYGRVYCRNPSGMSSVEEACSPGLDFVDLEKVYSRSGQCKYGYGINVNNCPSIHYYRIGEIDHGYVNFYQVGNSVHPVHCPGVGGNGEGNGAGGGCEGDLDCDKDESCENGFCIPTQI